MKTDARGVETHYALDALHRVTRTWYTGVGGNDSGSVRPALPSGVTATGDMVDHVAVLSGLCLLTLQTQGSRTRFDWSSDWSVKATIPLSPRFQRHRILVGARRTASVLTTLMEEDNETR